MNLEEMDSYVADDQPFLHTQESGSRNTQTKNYVIRQKRHFGMKKEMANIL
jgi:hypothetical protein